jgi:hypothetical protein
MSGLYDGERAFLHFEHPFFELIMIPQPPLNISVSLHLLHYSSSVDSLCTLIIVERVPVDSSKQLSCGISRNGNLHLIARK